MSSEYKLGSLQEKVYDVLTDDWQTSKEIARHLNRRAEHVLHPLNSMAASGIIEKKMVDGEGHLKNRRINLWRRKQEGSEPQEQTNPVPNFKTGILVNDIDLATRLSDAMWNTRMCIAPLMLMDIDGASDDAERIVTEILELMLKVKAATESEAAEVKYEESDEGDI